MEITKNNTNLSGTRKCLFFVLIALIAFPTTVLADDYYWVGGNGNWSDINHWATTSGGSVLHAQVPTPNDDVFFDANSFTGTGQTITIDQKNAVCRNLDWTGVANSPRLYGHDTTSLRIYGNLKLIPGMDQDFNGEIIFESVTTGKVITTSGHPFLNNVYFRGIGGGWQLQDDLIVDNNIYFLHGSFETNGHQLSCNDFISTEPNDRALKLSTSAVNVTSWQINGQNLILQATSAMFYVESLLSNDDGSLLKYGNIRFIGSLGTVTNSNVYVIYNNIDFDFDGSISGDCKINTVTVNGNGSIVGSDTINQVIYNNAGTVTGGHHVIGSFIGGGPSVIEGNNEIGVALFYGGGKVSGTNEVDSARFFNGGVIEEANQIRKLLITRYGLIDGTNKCTDATLYGDGYFTGNNNFGTLTLSPGNTYIFAIFDTQTIENNLNITGDCYKPIRMLSDTNGVQAIIKCNAPVAGDYLSLRDLKAEGNVPFLANNSVDLGNNTNWNIQTTGGLDLYWVNGNGDWDDATHWDVTSGGPGGHCPPTEIDNAFFDGNSFSASGQAVNVNVKNAVCRDMIWKNVNGPLFQGADTNNVRIYGSLTLTPQMQWMFLGQTFFEATEKGQTITCAGNIFLSNVWFNGRGGSWELLDKLETNASIRFQQGEVYSLGNDITCADFSSTDTTTRKLCLSTSTVTMRRVGWKVWNFNAANLELCADSSLLISLSPAGDIVSFGGKPLIYNNVEFYGPTSRLLNNVYCTYNLVTYFSDFGLVRGNCTIDTVTFYGVRGNVYDSDIIKTAVFYGKAGILNGGGHDVEIAYFYDDGRIHGKNKVDTALFYRNAIIDEENIIDTCIVYNKAIIDGKNTIRTETLLGDGYFYGENTFDDLTLSRNSSYYLENNKTQTINDNLNINGACTGPIIIQSDENQVQATINKVNGGVEANYVALRDIKGTGQGIPFIAYNSVDMGNNTNWTIYTSNPKELYWVDGSGQWSDSLHWSGSSGGSGGYCIPSPIDNVYFDENSFHGLNDTVLIDVGNATCHNMSWTGAAYQPVFESSDTNFLRIFGSLDLNTDMNMDLYGPVFFESTHAGNFIASKGRKFLNDIYFQGKGGEWQLSDRLECDSTIYFSDGKITTDGNLVKCMAFNSDFTNPRELHFDESTIELTGSGLEVWFVNGINLTMSAANSLLYCTDDNALIRTDNGGPFLYHDVLAEGDRCRIYNKNAGVEFRKVQFIGDGQIHGDCAIDSVLITGSGGVFDSDNINFLSVNGDMGVVQGGHQITIARFRNNSEINGMNIFDSIVTNQSGLFSGNNQVNQYLKIGSTASISGTNTIHEALLAGDGRIEGTNIFDILTFRPGNTYELEAGATQTINNAFNIRGNNCFPITFRSLSNGDQAFVSIPAGVTVSGDFIEMRDINGSGGANYYAGKYSTDISNNTGWVFNNSPGYIFGFQADTTMCSGHELIIGTENFNPDENTTYLWQDGSTLPEFRVTDEDSLWVTVFYAFDCSYTDTILIDRKPSPEVNLGDDRSVCEGDSITFVSAGDSLTFLWNDGSTDSVYIATGSGIVWLQVIAPNGCSSTDSVDVTTRPAPVVFLGNDTTLRYDESIVLDAGNPGSTYLWSTGDTVQTITAYGSDEMVWVVVDKDGCSGNDTILLNEFPRCILAVPNAFSPNGDGKNDVLYVRGNGFLEFELMIFNRLGEMVFKTSDTSVGWDGTYKGKAQEVDVYMYVLKGRCADGENVMTKGNITLLR